MKMAADELNMQNPIFASFAFYATVCLLKMMVMAFLTAIFRMKKGIFANPEDTTAVPGGKINLNDPDVERVRRNHLNDIESILPFVLVGLFYVSINPSPFIAFWHFRLFTASRILHTFAYQLAIPQPSRGGCFFIGFATTVSMIIQVLKATF